jgi:hypothetical protein
VSCRVVSCRVVSCRVVSCRVVSYCIVLPRQMLEEKQKKDAAVAAAEADARQRREKIAAATKAVAPVVSAMERERRSKPLAWIADEAPQLEEMRKAQKARERAKEKEKERDREKVRRDVCSGSGSPRCVTCTHAVTVVPPLLPCSHQLPRAVTCCASL